MIISVLFVVGVAPTVRVIQTFPTVSIAMNVGLGRGLNTGNLICGRGRQECVVENELPLLW